MRIFHNLSIRYKLLIYMLIFTIIPIVVVTAVSIGITHKTMKNQLIYNHRVSSGWLQDRLNIELQETMSQIYEFEVDKAVRNTILSWCSNRNNGLGYDSQWTLITAMNSLISMNNSVNSIDLYNLQKDEILIAKRDGAYFEKTEGQPEFLKDRNSNLQTNLIYTREDNEILELHEIHRFEDNMPIALMVIHIRPYQIINIMNDIKSIPEESIFILNDQNELLENVLGKDQQLDEETVQQVRESLSGSGMEEGVYNHQFWFYRTVQSGKMQVLVSVPERTIARTIFPTLMIGLGVAFFAALASIIGSLLYAQNIARPIQSLSREMLGMQLNNYTNNTKTTRLDEIGVLERSFHTMIMRNQELIEQQYQYKLEKRSAQLRALQAQINPHFMYNTLQVIGGMSLKHKAPEIYKTTIALSDILRYSLNFSKETVHFREEVEYLKSYIMIQNERFGGRIELQLSLDEETLLCPVPKLILQPLAENAFEYGFNNMTGKCTLKVTSQITGEDDLLIQVIDNGAGFTSERLKEVRETLKRDTDNSLRLNSHIGLSNVHTRIRLSTNSEKYGISIESEPMKHTTISILLKR